MEDLYDRLDVCIQQINSIKNKVSRRDLIKMVRTIDRAMTTVDQTLVECRRLKKQTIPYREALQNATQLVDNLEKHILFAALIG